MLPPGAGKTRLGVEAAASWGRPTVVFGPNNAIVQQWATTWEERTSREASTSRELPTGFSALTYQSLAVFDGDGSSARTRLHPNGVALIERLHELGPLTIILDECHHLLQVWGELLDEVLADLPDALVLALTATPPELLTKEEAGRVSRLFGEITFQATIPALVSAGDLVPFQELVWFTSPTHREYEWLASQQLRAQEFVTELISPELAELPLLSWAALRRYGELSEPESDAVIRLAREGWLPMPAEAHVAERHQQSPKLADWLTLASDWLIALRAGSDHDRAAAARITELLPGIGFRATRHGIRPGQSLIDRVLTLSASKALAAVELCAAILDRDPQAKVLILTDFAFAGALPASLDGVVEPESGSARWVLTQLLADDRTALFNPLMVTGSMLAGGQRFADAWAPDPAQPGVLEVTSGSASDWVEFASKMLADGRSQILVSTRALLGEGWDAPQLTSVIDLTSATTTGAIVQTRGRALRINPASPDKVATNWTVTCLAPDSPDAVSDYFRLVRKHEGWFSVDDEGEIVDSVAHLDAQLSPFAAPTEPEQLNARALKRLNDPEAVRAAWEAVDPRTTSATVSLRIRGTRAPATRSTAVAVPPTVTSPAAGIGAATLAAFAWWASPQFGWVIALSVALAVLLVLLPRYRQFNGQLRREPAIADYASVIRNAMQAEGLIDAQPQVVTSTASDGTTRVQLRGATPEQSTQFSTALAETIGLIEQPRYLISRPVWEQQTPQLIDAIRKPPPDTQAWHQVPQLFGGSRSQADHFAKHWQAQFGSAKAVYANSPEGTGLLRALRWSSPLGEAAGLSIVYRRAW